MMKVSSTSLWIILLAVIAIIVTQNNTDMLLSIQAEWQITPSGGDTATKLDTLNVLSSSRTMILFVTYEDNDLNRKRIAEMYSLYKNNFMVVWGNTDYPMCPFWDMRDTGLCLDKYRISISKSHRLSTKCCGQEMAFMWAIKNRGHLFDNVWLMEDDVYVTDALELEKLMSLDSPADLVYEAPGDFRPFQDQWFYANKVLHDAKGLFNISEMKTSFFNVFRMSKDFLAALEEVYIDLGEEWFFSEALLPSVVVSNRYNLTHTSWQQQLQDTHSTYAMTVMPRCMTHFEKPGIYHPVKYQDGNFVKCPLKVSAPDIKEGSPYKNQVSILRSPSADTNQGQPFFVHGCVGPLGGSTNWNAIAGWIKYHEERWGLTHVDIFVLEEEFHVAKESFDAVGLDTSTVGLNFTLYSMEGEAWLARECRTNAILGEHNFLIEFELDRFLVSGSFDSLQDMFKHTDYPDAVVFPTYTNHYGFCNSHAMTFASATFVDHLFPSFNGAPSLCPQNQQRCHMSDGVIRHFMYGNNDQASNRNAHLIRFADGVAINGNAVGLHEALSTTKTCFSVTNCTHIGQFGECTDMDDIGFFEQQVTAINSILSDLFLISNGTEIKHHAGCYAKRYPNLLEGYCNGNVTQCHSWLLYDHYINAGSAAGLIWECDRKFAIAKTVTQLRLGLEN